MKCGFQTTNGHFFLDNVPSHMAKLVRGMLETLSWEVLPHATYSLDLNSSDYRMFASKGQLLAEKRFSSYEHTV